MVPPALTTLTPSSDRHDVRTGGAWTRGQRLRNGGIFLIVAGATKVIPKLPRPLLRGFGRLLGRIAYFVIGPERRIAHANVARVFPSMTVRDRSELVRKSYRTLGAYLGDALGDLERDRISPPLRVTQEALAAFEEARKEGRGVVFVSAHLGPWEAVARSLIAAGVPLRVIARESYDPRLTALYDRLRGGGGVPTIYRGGPAAGMQIARALRSGAVLGAPMDLASRVPSCEVPFLGSPAMTAIGPARLALRQQCPVVAGTAERLPAGEVVVTASRIRSDDLSVSRGELESSTRELTTRINEELSRRILLWPEAWVWMHRRW